MRTLVLALLLMLPLGVCAQEQTVPEAEGPVPDGLVFQDLFDTTMREGVACYRIPALVTAPNGDLLAAIDERVPSCADLRGSGDINIVLRRSSDGGATWSDIERVVDFPEGESASDPSMIVDAETGVVLLFYNFMDFARAPDVYRLHVLESADDGKTWSPPRDITEQITKPGWHNDFQFITSGRGIQTRSGRLLHTLVNLDKGLHLFTSTDHGATWQLIDTPITPGDESKVVELSDGTWMINSRVNKAGIRYVHTSADEGQTWTTRPDSILVDPGVNGSIVRHTVPETGESVLVFANANSAKARENLTLRLSYDDGQTWTEGRTVYPGPAAYVSMDVLPGGDLGLFFEKDEYTRNVFTRVPMAWLTAQ